MVRTLAKLLILIAMLAMPLGMSGAQASVSAERHDAAISHCPESAPAKNAEPGIAACTMACAAALPAIGASAALAPMSRDLPQPAPLVSRPASILLETATPPPRFA